MTGKESEVVTSVAIKDNTEQWSRHSGGDRKFAGVRGSLRGDVRLVGVRVGWQG